MSIFNDIYEENHWGFSERDNRKYYSGAGSHDGNIVVPYIESVQDFLLTFDEKPNIIDLGCGDFFLGSTLRAFCNHYIACDIVEPLISYNKEKFNKLDVDFRLLDITNDELPAADVVIVRQILQHLSNFEIKKFVEK